MKKILFSIVGFSFFVTALVVTAHVWAWDRPNINHDRDDNMSKHFNPNNELSKSSCGSHLGNPVINVVQRVQNDADSGVAGNYWAFDYYMRHITVWATPTANTYCAIVTYDGNFYTVPGQIGPGNVPAGALINTATNEPVHGSMSGGRRATIVGTLLTTPAWTTSGNVGTTNYQCSITGVCPGVISWTGQYFNGGYTYNDDWWGWKYNAGSHGTWINAVSGNSGNIL